MKRRSKLNKITLFDVVNTALVVLITLIIAYPLYFVIVASFSDQTQVSMGNTLLWIKGFNLDAYKYVLQEDRLWIGYRNSLIYTVLGTMYNIALTIPLAYVMSKQYLPFRGIISWYFFITMYFGGGMIPTYLLIKNLGLINNPLVMVVGAGVSTYNMIVARQYFGTSIHPELYEAAEIDGAGEWKTFIKIAVPLAKPIIAVLVLYYGVGHWNNYYSALLYMYKEEWHPLQYVLRVILLTSSNAALTENMTVEEAMNIMWLQEIARGMKYAVVFIASAPVLIAYPFVQKYFTKGIMIGSVKG